MAIQPWRATCIQIGSVVASDARTREEAWTIIEGNLANAIAHIEAACTGPTPPRLVVLPEFAFQGPPRATPVRDWIERACATIPGPITERLADVARRDRAMHHFIDFPMLCRRGLGGLDEDINCRRHRFRLLDSDAAGCASRSLDFEDSPQVQQADIFLDADVADDERAPLAARG